MSFATDTSLGPYKIIALIGSGGIAISVFFKSAFDPRKSAAEEFVFLCELGDLCG